MLPVGWWGAYYYNSQTQLNYSRHACILRQCTEPIHVPYSRPFNCQPVIGALWLDAFGNPVQIRSTLRYLLYLHRLDAEIESLVRKLARAMAATLISRRSAKCKRVVVRPLMPNDCYRTTVYLYSSRKVISALILLLSSFSSVIMPLLGRSEGRCRKWEDMFFLQT